MSVARRYFCEYEDCDYEYTGLEPPVVCPTCGRLGWAEFQNVGGPDILMQIFGETDDEEPAT